MNIFLALGIESFVQGDYIGGGALLGSWALRGILVITRYIPGSIPSKTHQQEQSD
ncbi:hypothetical protein HNP70_001077 [Borreliella kurtenbachii]